MKITLRLLCITVELALLCAVFSACGSSPAPASAPPVTREAAAPQHTAPPDELDAAIRETSNYLNKQLPKGNKLMILNVQSDFPALSEYIIDELIANSVNDRIFSVVDRQQLNTIRAELDFQMSGEVDDATAQSLGRMAGAQIIISGAVSKIGDLYRLRVRALSVQSAQIEGQFNKNIPNGPTVTALVNSKATGYGSGTVVASTGSATRHASSSSTPAVAPVPAPAVPAPSAPAVVEKLPVQATPAPSPAPPPVPAVPATLVYKVGDSGPAGGLIFYDKGDNTDGWRYLEVASKDAGTAQWGAEGYDLSGTDTKVGTGKHNTDVIMYYMRGAGESGKAAQLAKQYTQGGYTDWFLPSKEELNLIYINLRLKLLGDFSMGFFWSSSQNGRNGAWGQRFSDGIWDCYGDVNYSRNEKKNTYSIRAVRQF